MKHTGPCHLACPICEPSAWGSCKHHPGAESGCGECLRDLSRGTVRHHAGCPPARATASASKTSGVAGELGSATTEQPVSTTTPARGPEEAGALFCRLCKRHVQPGGHMCIREDGSGLPEEHLAECHCGVFHEPHCAPRTSDAPTECADCGATNPDGEDVPGVCCHEARAAGVMVRPDDYLEQLASARAQRTNDGALDAYGTSAVLDAVAHPPAPTTALTELMTRPRTNEAELKHLARVPFQAVCGADKPNQRTAQDPADVTCLACLRASVPLTDNAKSVDASEELTAWRTTFEQQTQGGASVLSYRDCYAMGTRRQFLPSKAKVERPQPTPVRWLADILKRIVDCTQRTVDLPHHEDCEMLIPEGDGGPLPCTCSTGAAAGAFWLARNVQFDPMLREALDAEQERVRPRSETPEKKL